MQNSAGVRRVRCATCTTSEHLSAESLLRPASRLHDGGVRNRGNSREKTRERPANFVRFRCNAHAKLGRRAPRALRNMHDVGAALSRITASSGIEIARLRRSKSRKFSRENARFCRECSCKFCSISVQRACRTRPACAACVESLLRLASRLHDCGVRNRGNFREKTRERSCKFCSISVQRACKTRPACAACVAQHAGRRIISQPNHCFVRHRDCTMAAFEN